MERLAAQQSGDDDFEGEGDIEVSPTPIASAVFHSNRIVEWRGRHEWDALPSTSPYLDHRLCDSALHCGQMTLGSPLPSIASSVREKTPSYH